MKKRLIGAACVLFWLIVWQICAMLLGKSVLLASPIEVAGRLIELVPQLSFLKSVAFTAIRILGGFFLGMTIGTAIAILAGNCSFVKTLLSPLVAVVKSVPVASFTILALIWISSRELSVLISLLIAIPVFYANVLEGIENLDPKLVTMADVFEIPARRRFVGVYLSQLLPCFRSACGLAIGLCWKSGVAAEVIGIPVGSIGEKLYMSKVYLETADLFAWTVVIVVLSWICEKLFMLLVNLLVKRVERM
ncbi:MAG: ABC transporter permease [Oscillospiraceae bacterium]